MNIFLHLTDILKTAQIIEFDLAVVFTWLYGRFQAEVWNRLSFQQARYNVYRACHDSGSYGLHVALFLKQAVGGAQVTDIVNTIIRHQTRVRLASPRMDEVVHLDHMRRMARRMQALGLRVNALMAWMTSVAWTRPGRNNSRFRGQVDSGRTIFYCETISGEIDAHR